MKVCVRGSYSEWIDVISGVPQGSVLGPLLFLIFVQDLPDWVKNSIKMFADDTMIWTKIASQDDADSLQHDLDRLVQWSAQWLLEFNPLKCKVMKIGHKLPTRYTMKDGSNVIELETTEKEKDLGVYYRAMHFSAKRGIAIACRLSVRTSVRPSVCDVGEL